MSTYRRVILDQEAVAYIRGQLEYESTLRTWLLQEQSLDEGAVVTYLPTDISDEAAKQFNSGGKVKSSKPILHIVQEDGLGFTMVPKGDTNDHLVMLLEQFLKKSENRVCIFEEILMRPQDPGFPDVDPRFVRTLNDEIYYVVSGSDDVKTETIQDLLNKANPGWYFLGVLTSVPMDGAFFEKIGKISKREIRGLAKKASTIIVGAYDGEGYLLWNKRSS